MSLAPTPAVQPARTTGDLMLRTRTAPRLRRVIPAAAVLSVLAPGLAVVTPAQADDAATPTASMRLLNESTTVEAFSAWSRYLLNAKAEVSLTAPAGNAKDVVVTVDPPGVLDTFTAANTAIRGASSHTVPITIPVNTTLPPESTSGYPTDDGLWDVTLRMKGADEPFAEFVIPVVRDQMLPTTKASQWSPSVPAAFGTPLSPGEPRWVAHNGQVSPTLARQWYRHSTTGGADQPITGATSATYTPTSADQGRAIYRADTATGFISSPGTIFGYASTPRTERTSYFWPGTPTRVQRPTFDPTTRTLTLPAVESADGQPFTWRVNGVDRPAGSFVPDTAQVSLDIVAPTGHAAVPADDKPFPWTIDARAEITAEAPTAIDRAGHLNIPATDGVAYTINGNPVAPGEHGPYTGTVDVTATATSSTARLVGRTSWRFTMRSVVTARAPEFDSADFTVSIPQVHGLTYKVNGVVTAPGTHTYAPTGTPSARTTPYAHTVLNRSVVVEASSNDPAAQELTGTKQWSTTFTQTDFTAARPTATNNQITLTPMTGYRFLLNGQPVTGTQYVWDGTRIVIEPTAANYSVSIPGSAWNYSLARTAQAPTRVTDAPQLNIPESDIVRYVINGEVVPAGIWTHPDPANRPSVTVRAQAIDPERPLSGTTTWSFTINPVAVDPRFNPTSTSSNAVQLRHHPALDYYVDGVKDETNSGRASGGQWYVTANPGTVRRIRVESTVPGYVASPNYVLADARNAVTVLEPVYSRPNHTYTAQRPADVGGIVPYTLQYVDENGVVRPLPFGTHALPDTRLWKSNEVHAVATRPDRDRLEGTTSWSFARQSDATVLPAPTAPQLDGTTVTVPTPNGAFSYVAGGTTLTAGTHQLRVGTVITAQPTAALARFTPGMTTTWTVRPKQTVPIVVPAPTVTPGHYRIPAHRAEVTYYADGVPVATGNHAATGLVRIEARSSNPRHLILGTRTWAVDLRTVSSATAPLLDADAMALTVPRRAGVEYLLDDLVVAPGTWAVTDGTIVSTRTTDAKRTRFTQSSTTAWTVTGTGEDATLRARSRTASGAAKLATGTVLLRPDARAKGVRVVRPRFTRTTVKLTATDGVRQRVVITVPAQRGKGLHATRRVVRFDSTTPGTVRVLKVSKRAKVVVTATARPGHRVTGTKRWVKRP